MEDIIRENLCDFCENYKRNNCMKIKGNENELYDILLCDREVIENELNKINFSKKKMIF